MSRHNRSSSRTFMEPARRDLAFPPAGAVSAAIPGGESDPRSSARGSKVAPLPSPHQTRHTQLGYSLLELIIVIAITSAIALSLTMFTINGLGAFNFLQAQSGTSLDLDTLADRIAKVVRGATSVDTAQSGTLIVYGYFSPQDTIIKKIRYFISGTDLNIGVTPPTGTAPNYTFNPANETVTTTRIDLAMGANPLFTYYDDVGNQLTGVFQVSQIKQVGIYLAANPNVKQVPVPISLSTKVTLRNLKVNL